MSSKRKITTAVITLIVLTAVGGFVYWKTRDDKPPYQEQSPEARVSEEQSSIGANSNGNDRYQGYSQVSVSLTSPVNGQQYGQEPVVVRAIINGTSSGTCTVRFSQAGQPDVVETAPVVAAPTYYTCNGFDVARSRFPVGGQWQLKLNVKSDRAEGNSEERTIVLN